MTMLPPILELSLQIPLDYFQKNISQIPKEFHHLIRTKTISTPLAEFILSGDRDDENNAMDSDTGFIDIRDAFATDRLVVERSGRGSEITLKRVKNTSDSKLGEAQDKIAMSRDHFRFLQSMINKNITITSSNSLLGTMGRCVLLGRLGRHINDSTNPDLFWFEDLDGRIRIDLHAWVQRSHHGFGILTEGSFLLCSGDFDADEKLFHVHDLELPQLDRYQMRQLKQNYRLAPFGLTSRQVDNILQVEQSLEEEENMVILQDVHLDDPNVMRQLQTLFEAYAASTPPSLFLLIGSFVSKDHQHFSRKEYKALFQNLALLLTSPQCRSLLEASAFVFVPGPHDPTLTANAKLFPRAQIPNFFIKSFKETLNSDAIYFTSNPCHIRFLSRHITVFRDDILQKMARHCVVHPDSEHPLHVHLCKTLQLNAHLAPLDQGYHPSFWKYEHAMRLIPSPDAVIVADRSSSFAHTEEDTCFVNPSSFSRYFSFVEFYPLENRVEFKKMT